MHARHDIEIAALDRDGCGVHASFTWLGDRYGHSVLAIRGGETIPLLEANGATSHYGLHETPPFQDAVKHVHDDWRRSPLLTEDLRPSLLLTGAGEGRYWSATVTAITDSHFALLCFDFACRQRSDASMPVVLYRISAGVTAEVRNADGDIVLRTADGREFNLWATTHPLSVAMENLATCRLALTQQSITIEPIGGPHFTKGATVQWSYEISAVRVR